MQRTKKTEENKIKTRKQIKKGISKCCCRRQSIWLLIAPLSHRYCYDVFLLLLRCCTAIAPLSFRCRSTAVAPFSRCWRISLAPALIHCRSADVAPAVTMQSHRYRTAISPLLLCCCRSCCCYAVTPLSHRYRSVVTPLLNRCRSGPERV